MIYFAKLPTGSIKIGTSVNVDRRAEQLASHYGCEIEILHTMEGGRDVEVSLHRRFSHLRLGKTEQFQPGPDLAEFIGLPLFVAANPETVEAQAPQGSPDVTIKVDAEVVQAIRLLAAHRNVSLNQMATDLLRGPVAAAHAEMLRELTQASQPAADDAPARPSRRKPKAP